jgi:C-terminal processing protease CtpA/Prc
MTIPSASIPVQSSCLDLKTSITRFWVIFLLTVFPLMPIQAQPSATNNILDSATRSEVIEVVLNRLDSQYVFSEVAEEMILSIREHVENNDYDNIADNIEFAQTLTNHLRVVSNDKHLSVNYSPEVIPLYSTTPPPGLTREQNYGFVRVERLQGNIGYIDFRLFAPPRIGGDTVVAAMTFIANSDAVIFDIRQNGGGSPEMVAFITSYLFGTEPVHLNDYYVRFTDQTSSTYTLAEVPGPRLTDKDVYVLTSSRTFSGAEEFAYNLKNLERATIVGETTGGGAHITQRLTINEHFYVNVPSGRAINAVTGTNWEGVGVVPNISVPSDDALDTAYEIALEKQLERLPDDNSPLRQQVFSALETLRKDKDEQDVNQR